MESTPFKAPAGKALPGKLAISRSLRPLMKKVPSRKHMTFDEHATVHKIAESDTWIPVLQPERSRWLDVVLVVDESPSMIIWYETISELKELLEYQGAFRNIQLWGFTSIKKEESICLHEGLYFDRKLQKTRDPKELIDPNNRRLILVISDCVSPAWHDGTVSKLLKTWDTTSRVSILQMLPHYLWKRTCLRNAENVYLQCISSNTVNSKLEIEPSPFEIQEPDSNTLKLPVITLENRSILPWAKSLIGTPNVWIPGVLLQLLPNERHEDDVYEKKRPASEMSIHDQLKYFMATASPEAQNLLKCLAALPLTLPVIRLAQRVILPNTRQVHLAEIFLSGLLKQNKLEPPYSANIELSFEFEDGIRELLIRSQPVSETVNALSVYIESHLGGAHSLRALVANPDAFSLPSEEKFMGPFAQISTKILRLLGGQYSRLAEKIETVSNDNKINSDKTNTENKFIPIDNPYIAKNTKQKYMGREDAYDFIDQNILVKGNRNNIFCHGQPRTGKTSLLYRILEKGFSDQRIIPVYLDVQAVYDEKDLYLSLTDCINDALKIENTPGINHFGDFKRYVKSIKTEKIVAVLFDEFEELQMRVDSGIMDKSVFSNIRHLMQHEPKLVFIFCSRHKLEEMAADYTALSLNINFLSKENTIQLITEPVQKQLTYDELTIEYIYKLTHGHPYLTQLICHAIVDDLNHNKKRNFATINDVENAVDEIIDTGYDYSSKYIWETSNTIEHLILSALAQLLTDKHLDTIGSEPIYQKISEFSKQLTRQQYIKALDRLMSIDVLFDKNARYGFTVLLFRNWVYKRNPLEKVRAEID